MNPEIHHGSLYNYSAGMYCGVLVTESVMKKLVRVQARHLHEVKQLLLNELERGNVFSSSWTLHYPSKKQTSVYYISPDVDTKERINNATFSHPPKHEPLVFIAESMDEAEKMADQYAMGAES